MAKKGDKSRTIVIKKEKLRPRERAPILPSKPIEDRRKKEERREKGKAMRQERVGQPQK